MRSIIINDALRYFFIISLTLTLYPQSGSLLAGAPLHPNPTAQHQKLATPLREAMSRKIQDIDHVDRLLTEYRKFKDRIKLDPESREVMNDWMLQNCYFIGSCYYNHNLIFRKLPKFEKDVEFRKAYKEFIAKIKSSCGPLPLKAKDKTVKKIAILYSGCYGGGHRAPAMALQQNFEKAGHHAQLVDIDVFINHYSPCVQGYTLSQIYPQIFQKEGNIKKARLIKKLINAQHKPERLKYLWALKSVLSDYQPDHIFSVAHHRPELSFVAYQLAVPMTYVHTDYHYNKHLLPIMAEQAKLKRPLVNFTALTRESCFLKNVHDYFKPANGTLPELLEKQIVRLDFPVRDSFVPLKEKEIQELRAASMIPRNAVVCKLAVGQNPMESEIKRILMRLIEEEKSFKRPHYLFVICGSNIQLKSMLDALVKRELKGRRKLHVEVCGFLGEKDMAKVDQMASVWITKPGGSTCAELVQTRKQMIVLFAPNYVWEHGNAVYLQSLGMAAPLSRKRPLSEQIKSRLYYYNQARKKEMEPSKWRDQSLYILESTTRKLVEPEEKEKVGRKK